MKLVLMEITLVGVVWLQCFVVTLVLQSFDFLRIAQEVMKEDRSFIKVVNPKLLGRAKHFIAS